MALSTPQNFQKYLIDLHRYDGLYTQHLLFVEREDLFEAATALKLDKVKKYSEAASPLIQTCCPLARKGLPEASIKLTTFALRMRP